MDGTEFQEAVDNLMDLIAEYQQYAATPEEESDEMFDDYEEPQL